MMLVEPLLLLSFCFCGLGLAAPNGQSPAPPCLETMEPPAGSPAYIAKELVRRGRPAIAAREPEPEPYESELVKRQRCPVLWVTCGLTCCLIGQECYTDSYGKIGCKDMYVFAVPPFLHSSILRFRELSVALQIVVDRIWGEKKGPHNIRASCRPCNPP